MRLLEVVERDQPVGEDERGVGQSVASYGQVAVAVGLELVAEVADEAAVEVERQVVREVAQAAHLPVRYRRSVSWCTSARGAALDTHLPSSPRRRSARR